MSVDPESLLRIKEKIKRNLGDTFLSALNDPNTIEIMLNADGSLWQEKLGEKMKVIGNITESNAHAAMRTIATALDTTITRTNPILEGELPLDNSRFAGWIPPIVSAPTFAVRKKASVVFSLKHYVKNGAMTQRQYDFVRSAVERHKNILVIGGTGSGKTTLTNAVIAEMVNVDPLERIFIIEDTGEIQCSAENSVQFYTSLEASMTDLLKTTLRGRPDRILVGEVRGAEALDLLDAWNTGHEGGVATLHANNATSGLDRLKSLITRNPSAPKDIERLIGEAVHVVIHIAKTSTGRVIQEIIEVSGYDGDKYLINSI
ncbi:MULTISPECIES: P-type conjugative transfer ATPase TrbB [Pseudoalteromonas]|uniref:P-type conjugative transfer ATPase TrbB n=1 Tax=Pseudoalteromonas TaxID=53246 RepID=UPI001EF3DC2B|nr:P-type conjugative transfer ATPase TrbB [Pseudoalteromonas sp. Of11M-6]MCG7556244.1 P-type conjugative transfer ATPase TrbB [Pseudoalteromonas sp. Of11M-6]